MASTTGKALISVGRMLLALVVGIVVGYYWQTTRVESGLDPWYYAYATGFIVFVIGYFMLNKLKGGGD